MDIEKKHWSKNPLLEANCISKFCFFWILPLFKTGSKKDLGIEDLFETLEEDRSETLGDILARKWEKHLAITKKLDAQPSLVKVLIILFGRRFFLQQLVLALNMWVFRVAQPICMQLLIRSYEDNNSNSSEQLIYAVILCVAVAGNVACQHHNVYSLSLIGMQCRIACSSLIYRKTLKLSRSGEGSAKIGQLVNLLSNDVARFDRDIFTLPFLVTTPVQLIIFSYFLWKEVGVSCFAGMCIFALLIPVQYFNGKLAVYYRRKVARCTDERSRIMSEIINGIRVIKMYAWEKPYSAIVNRIRKTEVSKLKKRYYIFGIYSSFNALMYKLIPFLIILTYVLTGHKLTADKVFYTVLICNSVTFSMNIFVQAISTGTGELLITIKRIQQFLLLEEKSSGISSQKTRVSELTLKEPLSLVPMIKMDSICASWDNHCSDNLVLRNMNFHCGGNQLVAVVGTVGSGKSSLLNFLIGELQKVSGSGSIQGKISYASQEPWIFDGTVRQNIIFGNAFDKRRYEEVTKAVALQDDFQKFPYGDLSLVGERGITLSGGQKARVNLARAIYQKADIYLLDDPLSAVDIHVGRHLFDQCMKTYLKDSLRILVTHQLQFLPQVDHIALIEKGEIIAEGSFTDLESKGVDFITVLGSEVDSSIDSEISSQPVLTLTENTTEEKYKEKQSIQEEKMMVGAVNMKTYWEFLMTGHSISEFWILASMFLMYQIAFSYSEYWLSIWTNAEKKHDDYLQGQNHKVFSIETSNSTLVDHGHGDSYKGQSYYIGIYSALVGLASFSSLCRSMGYTKYFTSISENIHNKMLSNVIYSPVKFFDTNNSGRLMNRFTKDLGQVDEMLPATGFDTVSIFLRLFGTLAVVIAANYYMAVPSLLIIVLLWWVRKYYVKTARDVKRIEGITKSPMFSHITATVQGLSTIRACCVEEKVIGEFDSLQDIHTSAWFTFLTTTRCFCVWIETISLLFVIIVTFSFLIITSSTMAGNIGLAVSSALSLSSAIQFGMRQSAETENLMTSAERTLEYTKLKPEGSEESKDDKTPPPEWPQHGHIEFRNVSLSYSNVKVLNNISFKIEPKEKIGIVGRTGAGKSSIVQALFRMTEIEGEILVDGISANSVCLHLLRKNMSIIPQDPVLFSGTIRYNLDPFEQFPDDELWKVIQEVELKSCIPSLDFKVLHEGNNFSVGQKQLVCLARAILRNNKIIIMDEATANVDPRTDCLIQKTIREKFSECTIITIAHRVHSIINGDKILVLDKGEIVEMGSPDELLADANSFLFSMREISREGSKEMLNKINDI